MPRCKIYVRDKNGLVNGTINGVIVDGPLIAARNINYVPEGAIVSAIGTASFELPLQFAVNNAVQKGNYIEIWQEDVSDGPVFWGVVNRRPRTFSKDGIYARIDCSDVLIELTHVNTTSGFISRNLETNGSMLQRLVARQKEHNWAVRVTAPLSYPTFSAYSIEVLRAVGKYCSENFLSYRRETYKIGNALARRLLVGQFSTEKSGLRLVIPQKEFGNVPYEERPKEILAVKSATFDDDATIVNRLIPTAGNDTSGGGISLGYCVYDPTFRPNPKYPIQARLREDITTPLPYPGAQYPVTEKFYEFYIEDSASILANGVSEQAYPRTDLVPLSTNIGDMQLAAKTLYNAAVAYLEDHINPHLSLDITTEHRGDLRNIGGKTVYVRCKATSKQENGEDVYTMDIEGDYRIQSIEVSNADGEGEVKWTLSTDGRSVETDAVMFQGALEDIDYRKKVPTLLLAFPTYPIDGYFDSTYSYTQRFPNSNALIEAKEVVLDYDLIEVFSTMRPRTHAHNYTVAAHSHRYSFSAHSHSVSISSHTHTYSVNDHSHSFSVSAHSHSFGIGDHAHGYSWSSHTHGVSDPGHSHGGNASKVWLDPVYANEGNLKVTATVSGTKVMTDLRAGTYGSHSHTSTHSGTGITIGSGGGGSSTTSASGSMSGNTGSGGGTSGSTGSAGGMNTSTGSAGGANINTGSAGSIDTNTDSAAQYTWATTTEAGSEWGLLKGAKVDIIRIIINGTYIGDYSGSQRIDITPYWKIKQNNNIEFIPIPTVQNPTGLGRIRGAIMARMIGTTLADQSVR